MDKQLVLASKSPRRQALLEQLGLNIEVRASHVEETGIGTPSEIALTNAQLKCAAVAEASCSDELVIAADTIVVHQGTVLEKPATLDEARSMLTRLSGDTHEVLTALVLFNASTHTSYEAVEITEVTFRELTQQEIERFVSIVKPLDRAGAYTVDGPGSLLVERYDGCYYNVLGLPLVRLNQLLSDAGFNLFAAIDPLKTQFL
ncbi:MAG: Maf family protein [Candidatus Hydrogenedentota bacterium]